jgi:hypothetical protein
MPKINLDNALYERAKSATEAAGYSSVDELVAHAVENELQRLKIDDADRQVTDRLRGLGYIE